MDSHSHHFLSTTFLYLLLFLSSLSDVEPASFKFVNRCRYTIWPGLLSGAGTAQLSITGFALPPDKSRTVSVPKSWSGRVWGRTLCALDSEGKFACLTGDCGSGEMECSGTGAKPPATLAEFTLNGDRGLDFFDVSLVDGYNLPMLVIPKNGSSGGCSATGCLVNLNGACPRELKLAAREHGGIVPVACRSACEAFGDPRFCCSGAYDKPETCPPTAYSEFFKHACPRAYSYAYDDKTSTYTCTNASYVIMFCPPPHTSQVLLGARKDGAVLPLVNRSMMYLSGQNGGSSSGLVIAAATSILVALLVISPVVLPL